MPEIRTIKTSLHRIDLGLPSIGDSVSVGELDKKDDFYNVVIAEATLLRRQYG